MNNLIERASRFPREKYGPHQRAKMLADFAQSEINRIADDLEALAMDSDDLVAALLDYADGLRGKK